jgi:hypothetical protein
VKKKKESVLRCKLERTEGTRETLDATAFNVHIIPPYSMVFYATVTSNRIYIRMERVAGTAGCALSNARPEKGEVVLNAVLIPLKKTKVTLKKVKEKNHETF